MVTYEYQHVFKAGESASAVLLVMLHGTGGDEHDLLPLAAQLLPGANVLSPRGDVREGMANRFFRRHAEGVFDVPDLRERAGRLGQFIAGVREGRGLTGPVVLVGYSNGANIAGGVLLGGEAEVNGAVLLRPMVPYVPAELPDLAKVRVLLTFGLSDNITPPGHVTAYPELLRRAGAEVEAHTLPAGHGLTAADLKLARDFMQKYLH